jgi:hypothetical protein
MASDDQGRPICRLCARPITRAYGTDHGQSFVLLCEACGTEETVPITQLRDEQRRRRTA